MILHNDAADLGLGGLRLLRSAKGAVVPPAESSSATVNEYSLSFIGCALFGSCWPTKSSTRRRFCADCQKANVPPANFLLLKRCSFIDNIPKTHLNKSQAVPLNIQTKPAWRLTENSCGFASPFSSAVCALFTLNPLDFRDLRPSANH